MESIRNRCLNTLGVKILIIISATSLNCVFYLLNAMAGWPLFLDSIFTVVGSAIWGYFPGILIGGLTNVALELLGGNPGYLWPFGIVNIVTAIATRFMVDSGFLRSLNGIFWIIFVLAITNSILGALIVTLVYGGFTNQLVDNIVRTIMITAKSIMGSAFLGRMFINLVDKGISVFCMVILYTVLNPPSVVRSND